MTRKERRHLHRQRWIESQLRALDIRRSEIFNQSTSDAMLDFVRDSFGVELTVEQAIDLTT